MKYLSAEEISAINQVVIEEYTIHIAVNNPDLSKVADWIEKHSKKT